MRRFGALVLPVVVARMLLLGILGFIFFWTTKDFLDVLAVLINPSGIILSCS
jgi:hypothetical protein